MKKIKTLYFEGAGWEGADSSKATIGNCRIRTAFRNNNKKCIYLEMSALPIYKKKTILRYAISIDHLFYITGDKQDENINRIPYNRQDLKANYVYSIESITNWINKYLSCNFDRIMVLPFLAGYRVHKNNSEYNFAENFIYDKELTEKREAIRQYFYDIEKSEGKEFPNFSLWVDDTNQDLLHLLRHFNEYNKHWTINTSIKNCLDTLKETQLEKYGC